jgi:hypothetical protein
MSHNPEVATYGLAPARRPPSTASPESAPAPLARPYMWQNTRSGLAARARPQPRADIGTNLIWPSPQRSPRRRPPQPSASTRPQFTASYSPPC